MITDNINMQPTGTNADSTVWATVLNTFEFYVIEVSNVNDAAKQIKALKTKLNAEIGTIYFDSHGSRKENTFRIGSQIIKNVNLGTRRNSVLKVISAELVKGKTNVVLLACHAGSNDPGTSGEKGRGDNFVQKLANRFDTNVFANISWSPSGDIFGNILWSPDMVSHGNSVEKKECPQCEASWGMVYGISNA